MVKLPGMVMIPDAEGCSNIQAHHPKTEQTKNFNKAIPNPSKENEWRKLFTYSVVQKSFSIPLFYFIKYFTGWWEKNWETLI